MQTSITILKFFCAFAIGALLCLFAVHSFIIQPQAAKSQQIVRTVVSDASQSRVVGARGVVDQCKELGFAFIPASDNTGYLLKCSEDTVEDVSDEAFIELSNTVKQYSSRRK